MERRGAHPLYGSTDESFGIPDASALAYPNPPASDASRPADRRSAGPLYDKGALILGESFRKGLPGALDGVVGQRLADALAVWECYDDAWMRGGPLLLRFEDFDLVASRGDDGGLALWQGIVDTARRIGMARCGSADAYLDDRLCLSWKYDRSLSVGIGSQAIQIAAATDELLVLDFEDGGLVLECGPNGLRHRFEGR